MSRDNLKMLHDAKKYEEPEPMTDRELLQQALDALISVWNMDKTTKQVETIQAIKIRLAQPEPKCKTCKRCQTEAF